MADLYINRRLKIGEEYFSEEESLEQGAVLVVLAEPGAGKSELLKNFGRLFGVVPVRASRFRHQTQLAGNTPLIIDALDELAKIDQSSIDQVVVKAQEIGNGRVIFASRSSEWQEARTKWIHECFGTEPTFSATVESPVESSEIRESLGTPLHLSRRDECSKSGSGSVAVVHLLLNPMAAIPCTNTKSFQSGIGPGTDIEVGSAGCWTVFRL